MNDRNDRTPIFPGIIVNYYCESLESLHLNFMSESRNNKAESAN